MRSVVVVGASLAGLRSVEALRGAGYDGRVTVVGDEPHRPYDRPPLSKQVLAGTWQPERIALEPATGSLDDLAVDWRLGVAATGLDTRGRRVPLSDGTDLGYDGLVVATGAAPRRLRGQPDLAGVHVLRGLDDCLALRADLDATPRRVVVVGAGFLGAEVAATARSRGLEVTLLEALPLPLGRVFGDDVGSLFAEVHRDHGVDLRVSTGVERFLGDGRVEALELSDGTTVTADVVVVAVGAAPATGWMEGSGLALDDGVVCDEACRAAPGVVAAGDVARWFNPRFGEHMRVEHWENAIEQGGAAARTLLAGDDIASEKLGYAPVPWFWSDQFEVKLQFAGRTRPGDDMVVVDGSLAERRFVALYGRAGRLVGVVGARRPRPVLRYRALIAEGTSWQGALAAA